MAASGPGTGRTLLYSQATRPFGWIKTSLFSKGGFLPVFHTPSAMPRYIWYLDASSAPREINAVSSSLKIGAFASPQKTIFAPACPSRSARTRRSLSTAAPQLRIESKSLAVGRFEVRRFQVASLGDRPICRFEREAIRTVGDEEGESAILAPPASIIAAIAVMQRYTPRRARVESQPSSQSQLHTAANQAIRKLTPHSPVTDRSCNNARLPYCE